jgi:hypothetical protein
MISELFKNLQKYDLRIVLVLVSLYRGIVCIINDIACIAYGLLCLFMHFSALADPYRYVKQLFRVFVVVKSETTVSCMWSCQKPKPVQAQ